MFLEKMVAIKREEISRKKDPSRLRELKEKAEDLPPLEISRGQSCKMVP